MGIKNIGDLTQLNPAYPDALNPVRKEPHIVAVYVTRAMTTATKIAVLPADATITNIRKFIQTFSNATTSATVTFTGQGVGPQGQAMAFGSDNVLAAGGAMGTISTPTVNTSTGIFNLERPPAVLTTGDIIIYGTYAETGTASTAGGPFLYLIEYLR